MRKGRDGEKTGGGHYVIASSRPPERRPLERRPLVPKVKCYDKGFGLNQKMLRDIFQIKGNKQ